MEAMDIAYGDLPAHDGLWQSASATRRDVLARLAVVPLVLEARGLDVTPGTAARLRQQGQDDDADMLEIIYRDEIVHVAAGVKWFNLIADAADLPLAETYRNLVRRYFKGRVRGPFNAEGRDLANFPAEYYENVQAEPAGTVNN